MNSPVLETSIETWPVKRGKVRDVYDLGDRLLLVATDRISAFDWVLPTGIPDKGRVLTEISHFWFEHLGEPNHLLDTPIASLPFPPNFDPRVLAGRSMLVKKTTVVPIECVVRGYLAGSGWKEYQANGTVCGIKLPTGLQESSKLPEPIFTPATKAESGHDENISYDEMCNIVGERVASELRERSIALYSRGAKWAAERGIIVADTKFEWGAYDGKLILIDEVLTPDSSRFWPADSYQAGGGQMSFDKQYVRDWLQQSGWDKNSPPPELPAEIVAGTRAKYIEAYERIAGRPLPGVRAQ